MDKEGTTAIRLVIDKDAHWRLKEAAVAERKSVSEWVREALAQALGTARADERRGAITAAYESMNEEGRALLAAVADALRQAPAYRRSPRERVE